MATTVESSPPEDKPVTQPADGIVSVIKSKAMEETTPWIEYAAQQARIYQQTVEEKIDSTTTVVSSRFSEILSTSSVHFNQTIDSLKDLKSELRVYESKLFGRIKECVEIAVSHPLISTGIAAGSGLVLLKGPRRFLYYSAQRRFTSEESLLSKADAKVKGLRQSIDLLKVEKEKLEKSASSGEAEFIRGKTKLRQAGKQIRGVIYETYKVERQADGLRDALNELPSRQASKFRSQVSGITSDAKRERGLLSKEVTKISNYGISI